MIRPRGNNVAVIVDKSEETLTSGLILSTADRAAQEKQSINFGVIAAIGPKVREVSVGQKIAFIEGTYWKNEKRTNPNEFEVDGVIYTSVPESEIRGIIEE